VLGTSLGKPHIFRKRVRKVTTSEVKWGDKSEVKWMGNEGWKRRDN
jgi:hypothetical protein